MTKTPAVAYFTRKIRTTSRNALQAEIEDAPLKDQDRNFLTDIIAGMSYKELAAKYRKSESRIYKWKRKIYETMTKYETQKLC